MDYKNFKVPYISREKIIEEADLFRRQYWNQDVPVDVEEIMDLKLKIDIVPTQDLFSYCDVDAIIASDWKRIYVDKQKYLDDRYQNRLRFSLAHEMGHFALHKTIYKELEIKTIKDFYDFINDAPDKQYGYLETQASKFASHLLIPRERLKKAWELEVKKLDKNIKNSTDVNLLRSYVAIPLSNLFGVSENAVEVALSNLDG